MARKNEPGAQPGNQNARSHGWFSKHDPAAPDQLQAAAKDALRRKDAAALRRVARAYAVQGDKATAKHLRQLATRLSASLASAAAIAVTNPPEDQSS